MSTDQVSLPRGTQDYPPHVMVRRNYIIDTIKKIFERYGYLPLETPAMENLSVLTGKYGEEGDQLLFKILNSGNFLEGIEPGHLASGDARTLALKISDKGLRYDLTVPFARYVAMNHHEIVFPFKRYQVQPVWRADRPQKGRYREFYQCDADVVGTGSLICEAEILMMIGEVFAHLGVRDFTIRINSRKILEGITEVLTIPQRAPEFFVLLDKVDKIGEDKFRNELRSAGFPGEFIQQMDTLLQQSGHVGFHEFLKKFLSDSSKGTEGLEELRKIMELYAAMADDLSHVQLDYTLARGLSYYTGTIFETKISGVNIGSVGGGGRYDNLTGVFGLPGISGVGFSFGIDRLYDALEELELFPEQAGQCTRVLVANFGGQAEFFSLGVTTKLRAAGINTELYPENDKIKKQLNYANKKRIPYVLFIGSEEITGGKLALKDMRSGTQDELTMEEIIEKLNHGD